MADQPAKDIAALQKQLDKLTKLVENEKAGVWQELSNLRDAIEQDSKRIWKVEGELGYSSGEFGLYLLAVFSTSLTNSRFL
jgi:hypothetical protein